MMNILIKKFKKFFYGVALSMYATAPVLAADIEIFTDSNSAATTAQPNVMFIMDSSDNMRSEAAGAVPAVASYDPATTYADAGFDTASFYYRADGVAPAVHNANDTFLKTALHCDHSVVDYATGVISSESVSNVAGPYTFTTTVTVNGSGTNGETRDIDILIVHDNATPADTSDDVTITNTDPDKTDASPADSLRFNTGDELTLGAISTNTDSVSVVDGGFTYVVDATATITGTGTGLINPAKGDTREVNIVIIHDNSTPGVGNTGDDVTITDVTVPVPIGYGPLFTVGFYSGQLAQYEDASGTNNDDWQALDTNQASERSQPIECEQDQGIHGHNTSNTSTNTYLVNGPDSSSWSASTTENATIIASLWPEASDNFYTVYHANYLNYLVAAPAPATGVSLFQQLKNAIGIIVGSASNINIGIMQFDRKLNNSSSVANDGLNVNGDIGDISDNTNLIPAVGPSGNNVGGEGAGVQYPALDVNLSRQNFYSNLRVMDAEGDAPLSEVYYEALRYFGGKKIDYGNVATPPNRTGTKENGNPTNYQSPITDSCQKNYIIVLSNGLSTYDYLNQHRRESLFGFDAATCGGTYDPANTNRNANASDVASDDNCLDELAEWAFTDDVARRDVGETDTVLGDDAADSAYDDVHAGEQNITTYTVGFAVPAAPSAAQVAGVQLLKDTARKGGGEFVEAANEAELVKVINKLLTQILKVNSTFSSPAVSVNAFNRSTHLNDLYFTLFKPDNAEHWTGNLKKYKLLFDDDGIPFIADKNGIAAVNDTTGFFNEDAQSFWSTTIDGDEAGVGGAASLIGNTAADGPIPVRKVYTLTGAYANGSGRTEGVKTPAVAAEKDLTAAENLLSTTNAVVTDGEWDTLLNIAGHASILNDGGGSPIDYRDTLIDWINGRDVFNEVSGSDSRHVMGDPLHAEPALIQYGALSGVDADGDGNDDPDLVTYMATNDGYLHAIDSRDRGPGDSPSSTGGTELWTFIPQEILPNLDALLEDDGSEGKIYGLDGSVVPWIHDANNDGIITENISHTYPADDHVYLYFGMRRGLENLQTRNYIYALDVTKRDQPKFMWMIEAGTGTYDEVGQTWSTINVEQIKVGNAERTVLMFGGGYDLNQDSAVQRSLDSMGRAFYIVDAQTGERLWSAGPPNADATTDHDLILSDMLYSIPARVKPLDINGDGFIDRIYMGDMGGQLWRFDIKLSDATTVAAATGISDELSDLVTGGRIANLASDGSTTENRRFFFPPDVAFIVEEGVGAYLSILAASGNRAHPLQTNTHDRIYMIRDKNIYEPPPDSDGDGLDSDDYKALEVTDAAGSTDLHDATLNLVTEGTDAQVTTAVTELADRQGWFMDLSEPSDSSFVGEKSLSEPLIFSNVAIITTFLPASAGYVSAAICEPNAGTAALYFINIADGTPTYSSDDELGVRSDRRTLLKRGGIPPTPSIIITEDGTPTLTIGTEISDANANLNITKTYWYEVEDASSTVSP